MSQSPISAGVKRRTARRAAAALLLVVVVSSCSGSDDAPETSDRTDGEVASSAVTGPLCDLLPTGNDPGGPATLTSKLADEALTWIPVLTVFEAGARATGLAGDLGETDGVTILAPTDDAFATAFSRNTLDELLISRRGELRALLKAHIVDGEFSLTQLLEAGRVTTLAGDSLNIAPEGTMARLDDRAETVCADYRVANARIHVIDGVLGELPEPAPKRGPPSD